MDLLIVAIALAPLLAGALCLAWGWRRMCRHGWGAEVDRSGVSFLLMLAGCLLVSAFFFLVLVAASVPYVVAVSVEVVLCSLLIFWGEARLRAALLTRQRAEAAPWVILLGIAPLVIDLPIWIGLPKTLVWLYVLVILVLLAAGQYQLVKHWNTVGKRRHIS